MCEATRVFSKSVLEAVLGNKLLPDVGQEGGEVVCFAESLLQGLQGLQRRVTGYDWVNTRPLVVGHWT